jgi:hypothetical protein
LVPLVNQEVQRVLPAVEAAVAVAHRVLAAVVTVVVVVMAMWLYGAFNRLY